MKPRLFTFIAAGLIGLSFLLRAEDTVVLQASNPTVKTALTEVIAQQLDAFRAGDFVKAYTFAAPEIQQMFTLPAFEQMVKSSYPIMVQPGQTSFGAVLDDGTIGVCFVQLKVPDGSTRSFRYMFKHEGAGWKITGVEQIDEQPSKAPITA